MRGFKISRVVIIPLLAIIVLMMAHEASAAPYSNVTFKAGAYVIDMGTATGSLNQANGLKPYGLIYDLVINKQVPVYWAINPDKQKDGYDFTVNSSLKYRGGSFIIPAEYASLALPSINTWKAKGVKVGYIDTQFQAPIYDYITSFPNAVCDLRNGPIIIKAFYLPSEVPSTSYRLGSPQDLTQCADIYAMPHADPQMWTSAQKTAFYNFIDQGGFLWAACHAVSAIESPAPTYLGWYFLSSYGLIPWGSHSGPTLPYTYNTSSAKDPVMQFIGNLDNALQSGSEQVYLPRIGSGWRTTSTVAVWDQYQADVLAGRSPGPAGIVIYGRAFGNPAKGFITYETSHSLTTGTTAEDVDAARVYGNTLLLAGVLKRPNITISVPTTILSGQTVTISAIVAGGSSPTITWSSNAGGTFANPHDFSTTFTAPTVSSTTSIIIRAAVVDACSRKNFAPQVSVIQPQIMTLSKTDNKLITRARDINNYTIYYNNTGSVSATNVVVTDRLRPQLTYISSFPAYTSMVSNGTGTYLTWSIGIVAAGSTKKIRLNASVKDNVTVSTQVINDVSLSWTAYDSNFSLTAQDVGSVVPLTKSVNKTQAYTSDYLKYDLCPGYDGTTFLTNAYVKDVIPIYTTYVPNSANASGTYYSNRTIIWILGSNQKGTTGSVKSCAAKSGHIRNISVSDTYLDKQNPLRNFGVTPTLTIDGNGANEKRALIYFGLPNLPLHAVITSAVLNVNVTAQRGGTLIDVFRLTKYWCLQSNGNCNSCDGQIVVGIMNNQEPVNSYGATWTYYNYRRNILNCLWTTAGGDYDGTTSFGSFTGTSTGLKTVDITNLVRGWYSGTYALHGIFLKERNAVDNIAIASKEYTTPANAPCLDISWYVPPAPGTNVSIYVRPLLICEAGKIYVNMTVNSTQNVAINPPANLTVTGTNGAKATLSSGPTPSGPVTMLANKNYYFNYIFDAKAGAEPGSLTFKGSPTSTGSPSAFFNDSTSNSVLITPNLSYRVQIDESTPNTVSFITNNAAINDSSVMPGGVVSNTISTALIWPASIKVSKSVDLSGGPYCTNLIFTINVTNTGKATLNPVNVADTLPAGLNYVSSNGSEYMGNVTWSLGPMTAGQKIYLDLIAHVDGTVIGTLTNKVSVNGTAPNGNIVTSQAMQHVESQYSGISVSKMANISSGIPCNYTEFYLNVTNTGTAQLVHVYVMDMWADGLEYKSHSPSNATLDLANNTIYWKDIGPLNGSQTKRLSIVTHISGSYYGELPNVVLVSGKPLVGGNVTDYNFTFIDALQPSILINKTVNVSQGPPSTNALFTINVTNIGAVKLDPVEVVDTLPSSGLSNISVISSNITYYDGHTIKWSVGPLNVSQTKQLFVKAHIDGSKYGRLNNTVSVTGTSATGIKYYSSDVRGVTAQKALIEVEMNSNVTNGAPSTRVNFTINVTNTGNATLKKVNVMDTLPIGLDFVSAPINGTNIGNIVAWDDIGPLDVGQVKRLYFTGHINGEAYGPLTNNVDVTGTPLTGNSVTNQTSRVITAKRASIAVIKTSNRSSQFAEKNVEFTLNVTNTGEVKLKPVIVVDTLPDGVTYISSNGTLAGKVITWNDIGPLNVSQSKNLSVVVQINNSVTGILWNYVSVQGTPPTGDNVTNQSSKDIIALQEGPLISILKSAHPTNAVYGNNITFTIEVANIGSTTLNPVKVIDVLPTGLTYANYSIPLPDKVQGKTLTWDNIGLLGSGDLTFIHLYAIVDGDLFGNLTNYVNVTGKPPEGDNVTGNATAVVKVSAHPNLSIIKTATPRTVGPGGNVTYIINVTNTGDIPLSTVRAMDILPEMLSYVSDNRSGTVSYNMITWSNVGPLQVNQSTYISLNATVTL